MKACLLALVLLAPPANAQEANAPASRVLQFLQSISGRQTVAGIHNREPNAVPDLQTREVRDLTGRFPGLWSGDFLFKPDDVNARWAMVYEARRQWEAGSIVQLLLHVCPPTTGETCEWEGGILSRLTDEQWKDLVTDGGSLNKAWKARLDGYAVYLQYLEDAGVEVLFRPHHEMNQGRFWWGGRKGPQGTAALFRLTREHLVRTKGLSNLVWTWNVQDLSRDWAEYDPGREHWDVFSFDVYGDGYGRSWYDAIVAHVGERPMGIGECAKLPTPELLAQQPRWSFFMSWAELTFTSNSRDQIRRLYDAPAVLTRDELPDLRR